MLQLLWRVIGGILPYFPFAFILSVVVAMNTWLRHQQASHRRVQHAKDLCDAVPGDLSVFVKGSVRPDVPTIVFDAGTGMSSLSWALLQLQLSKFAATVSYDRKGLGFSPPSARLPTPAALLQDLRSVIVSAGLSWQPIVLVGHSTGASNCLAYAAAFGWIPGHVKGVVLLEPTSSVRYGDWDRIPAMPHTLCDENAANCQDRPDEFVVPRVATCFPAPVASPLPPQSPHGLLVAARDIAHACGLVAVWHLSLGHVFGMAGFVRTWGYGAQVRLRRSFSARLYSAQKMLSRLRRCMLEEAGQLQHAFMSALEGAMFGSALVSYDASVAALETVKQSIVFRVVVGRNPSIQVEQAAQSSTARRWRTPVGTDSSQECDCTAADECTCTDANPTSCTSDDEVSIPLSPLAVPSPSDSRDADCSTASGLCSRLRNCQLTSLPDADSLSLLLRPEFVHEVAGVIRPLLLCR